MHRSPLMAGLWILTPTAELAMFVTTGKSGSSPSPLPDLLSRVAATTNLSALPSSSSERHQLNEMIPPVSTQSPPKLLPTAPVVNQLQTRTLPLPVHLCRTTSPEVLILRFLVSTMPFAPRLSAAALAACTAILDILTVETSPEL